MAHLLSPDQPSPNHGRGHPCLLPPPSSSFRARTMAERASFKPSGVLSSGARRSLTTVECLLQALWPLLLRSSALPNHGRAPTSSPPALPAPKLGAPLTRGPPASWPPSSPSASAPPPSPPASSAVAAVGFDLRTGAALNALKEPKPPSPNHGRARWNPSPLTRGPPASSSPSSP